MVKLKSFSILSAALLTACGGGSADKFINTLTSDEIVQELILNGYVCTAAQKVDLQNFYAISNATNCAVPLQGGLMVAVPADTAVLQINDGAGNYTNDTSGTTSLAAQISAYNSSPHQKVEGALVSHVVSVDYTQTSLDTQIADWNSGQALKPVVRDEFLVYVTGANIGTIRSAIGTEPALDTDILINMPVGPNYTPDSLNVDILNQDGSTTGFTGKVTEEGNTLVFSLPVALTTLPNGVYDIGPISYTNSSSQTVVYTPNGALDKDSTCPVGTLQDPSNPGTCI